MTSYYSLQQFYRVMLSILLLVNTIGESLLLIYRINRRASIREYIASDIIIAFLTFLLFVLPPNEQNPIYFCEIPYIWIVVTICLTFLHLLTSIKTERRKTNDNITPDSIREAINDISEGVCFADPNGRIILCNKTMRELTYTMIGSYPQTISEIDAAFYYDKSMERELSSELFFFPNGSIREFVFKNIVVDGEIGWRQVTSKDVTDLYRVKEQLERENKRLTETNRKLNLMYEHITDAVREKESLEMKIRVHDTMGRSLITIQDIMENPHEAEKKLDVLYKTISVLSDCDAYSGDNIFDEVKNCEKMGIKLIIDGNIPNRPAIERIFISAIRECATNCVKHAHGHHMNANIQKHYGIYSITITNDGDKPKEKIREGSGLSSLRRSVEAIGGEMLTAFSPRFALLLNIPETENEV